MGLDNGNFKCYFQISCLLHLGQKGKGAVGVRYHKLGQYCAFFFFFLPILIWNGVNSQSKSNKLQYKNKNSILRKGTSKQNATVEILILKNKQ